MREIKLTPDDLRHECLKNFIDLMNDVCGLHRALDLMRSIDLKEARSLDEAKQLEVQTKLRDIASKLLLKEMSKELGYAIDWLDDWRREKWGTIIQKAPSSE